MSLENARHEARTGLPASSTHTHIPTILYNNTHSLKCTHAYIYTCREHTAARSYARKLIACRISRLNSSDRWISSHDGTRENDHRGTRRSSTDGYAVLYKRSCETYRAINVPSHRTRSMLFSTNVHAYVIRQLHIVRKESVSSCFSCPVLPSFSRTKRFLLDTLVSRVPARLRNRGERFTKDNRPVQSVTSVRSLYRCKPNSAVEVQDQCN